MQCFGPEASKRTARILPDGERVQLETDPTQDRRDRYGRLLAYVYRGSKEGPRGSVNYALVATGYAKAYVFGGVPFRYADVFRSAEAKAPPTRGSGARPATGARPRPRRAAAW